MSNWTHIQGVIEVSPAGRTIHECEYILKTVLDHLPVVTGSERDMSIHIVRKDGTSGSSSHDEFGMRTNNAISYYGNKRTRIYGSYPTSDEYLLVVEASLRDRVFEETKKEFTKWLTRLAKRVFVYRVLVRLWEGYGKEMIINSEKWEDLYESPSWSKSKTATGEPAWWEYLMWDRVPNGEMPLKLVEKYYFDSDVDEELDRRRRWEESFEEP